MFRKVLIALHLAGAALSIALLVSTYSAKSIITSKAKEMAVEKSRGYADPIAQKLRETLDRPVIGKLIRGNVRERLEAELHAYESSAEDWLKRLALGGINRAKEFDFPEVQQPLARKALDALKAKVAEVKTRLDATYQGLLADLRLFAITNLVAFVVAAVLCLLARTPRSRHWLLTYSFVMLGTAVVSIAFYVGQNWFWNFLRNDYLGWQYPVVIGTISLFGIATVTLDLLFSRPQLTESA
jgi:hypothetical protein